MFDPVWTQLHTNEVMWKVTFLFLTLHRNVSGDRVNNLNISRSFPQSPGRDDCRSAVLVASVTDWRLVGSSPVLSWDLLLVFVCLMLFCLCQDMKFGSSDKTRLSVSAEVYTSCSHLSVQLLHRRFCVPVNAVPLLQETNVWRSNPVKYMTINWRPRNKNIKALMPYSFKLC